MEIRAHKTEKSKIGKNRHGYIGRVCARAFVCIRETEGKVETSVLQARGYKTERKASRKIETTILPACVFKTETERERE